MNQLLTFNLFQPDIQWDTLKATDFEEVLEALQPALAQEFEMRLNGKLNFHTLFSPEYTPNTTRLGTCAEILSLLNQVQYSEDILAIHTKYMKVLSENASKNIVDDRMYHRVLAYTQSDEYETLSEEKKDFIHFIVIRDYEMNGFENENEHKQTLIQLNNEINTLKQTFDNNIYQTQNALSIDISSINFSGLPLNLIKKIQMLPCKKGLSNEKVYSVNYSSGLFGEIITYSDESFVRNEFFTQQLNIGRDIQYDNIPIAQKIVNLLHRKYELLGFKNPSEFYMSGNMFKKSEDVLKVFDTLIEQAKNKYDYEKDLFYRFSKEFLKREPQMADREYLLNKLEMAQFSTDYELIEEYFQEQSVIDGFQSVFGELFDIRFEKQDTKYWNDDVFCLSVFDKHLDNKLGEIILDLYSRENKRTGAFCKDIIPRQTLSNGSTSTPIVYIVCNFAKPFSYEKTWSFDKVKMFFHEMGHALNHVLTKTTVPRFSGTNNVQNDMVELVSVFFEKFCYDYAVLKKITSHFITNEAIPDEYIESLQKSQRFMKATQLNRHILTSSLDFEIFSNKNESIEEIEDRLIKKYINYTNDTYSIKQSHALQHIFTSIYSSGIYVYMWSDILAFDVLNEFKKEGSNYLEQKAIAKRFKDIVLSVGGSKDIYKQFILFKGSEPDITSFAKEYLIESKSYKIK